MSGKVNFGRDYFIIMRNLELRGKEKELNPISDAAARLFLIQWGFTINEIDEANKLFWDEANANKLENDLNVVTKRITDHISGNRADQERLVIQLAALGDMDFNITDDEADYVKWFQDLLDLKPSEFMALCEKGSDLAIALNFFGERYKEASR